MTADTHRPLIEAPDLRLKNQEKRGGIALLFFVSIALGSHLFSPPAFNEIRLRDFQQMSGALTAYKKAHGAYPIASFVTAYPNGKHEPHWIPGLVPDYLVKIPEDPRGSSDPTRQYMYASDGKNFKIISHAPEDFVAVAQKLPQLIDPRRPTWAYGIWTNGAAPW
jgi:hypothetical protein